MKSFLLFINIFAGYYLCRNWIVRRDGICVSSGYAVLGIKEVNNGIE